jgi:hypothetical protein
LDEDLRELERLARATPLDGTLTLRLARALERSGDRARAARELARAVDAAPSDAETLRELDRLTRGGVDPASPWPTERGSGRRSGRSLAVGPTREAVVSRSKVADLHAGRGFTVTASGSMLVAARGDVGAIVAVAPSGEMSAFAPGESAPSVLAGWTVGGSRDAVVAVAESGTRTELPASAPWTAGLGHIVAARGRQGIEARSFLAPKEPRWTAVIPRPEGARVFAPGGDVVLLTLGGLGARGSLHRFDLATGKAHRPISLERVGTPPLSLMACEDGALVLGLSGHVLALDPEGRTLWDFPQPSTPVALAGERAEIVVISEPKTLAPIAVELGTGRELWRSRDACLNGEPKVDANGVIYWRREQELVALDPASGKVAKQWIVGDRYWDFAFAGGGRVVCLRSASPGVGEVVWLE